MVERVQQSHTTTLFVAFVGNTRFEPADGTAVFASLHPHNENLTGPKVAGVNGRLIGSRGDSAMRPNNSQGGRHERSKL